MVCFCKLFTAFAPPPNLPEYPPKPAKNLTNKKTSPKPRKTMKNSNLGFQHKGA